MATLRYRIFNVQNSFLLTAIEWSAYELRTKSANRMKQLTNALAQKSRLYGTENA
jgi:hypothetical protein